MRADQGGIEPPQKAFFKAVDALKWQLVLLPHYAQLITDRSRPSRPPAWPAPAGWVAALAGLKRLSLPTMFSIR